MGNNTVQEDPAPDSVKALEDIASLGNKIKAGYSAVRIVSILIVVACGFYIYATFQGWRSPFLLPVLAILLISNQVYLTATRRRQKRLDEMIETWEAKFGSR